jgi:predicted transcriptional regulator
MLADLAVFGEFLGQFRFIGRLKELSNIWYNELTDYLFVNLVCMSNLELREKALILRKKEFSYSQIKSELGISKSTLSYWLRDYPLSRKRIDELRNKNARRIEKFRQSMFEKRKNRLELIYKQAKLTILPLTKKELLLAGLCLYWGDGTKVDWSKVALTNSDPNVLRFFVYWLKRVCDIDKKDLKIRLQLYCDMNIKKEILFWSEILSIPFKTV